MRWRGMCPIITLDCARFPREYGASHLRVRSWSFWAASWRLRMLMHQYGWRDGHCPSVEKHGESTRIEGWTL
jgi:hypothetical protein